ncbi:hypothetical protein HK102_007600, partial [Quaeritorhiza haematococci]
MEAQLVKHRKVSKSKSSKRTSSSTSTSTSSRRSSPPPPSQEESLQGVTTSETEKPALGVISESTLQPTTLTQQPATATAVDTDTDTEIVTEELVDVEVDFDVLRPLDGTRPLTDAHGVSYPEIHTHEALLPSAPPAPPFFDDHLVTDDEGTGGRLVQSEYIPRIQSSPGRQQHQQHHLSRAIIDERGLSFHMAYAPPLSESINPTAAGYAHEYGYASMSAAAATAPSAPSLTSVQKEIATGSLYPAFGMGTSVMMREADILMTPSAPPAMDYTHVQPHHQTQLLHPNRYQQQQNALQQRQQQQQQHQQHQQHQQQPVTTNIQPLPDELL